CRPSQTVADGGEDGFLASKNAGRSTRLVVLARASVNVGIDSSSVFLGIDKSTVATMPKAAAIDVTASSIDGAPAAAGVEASGISTPAVSATGTARAAAFASGQIGPAFFEV